MISYESLIAKLDDSLNAILVKELRQTVRGKFFWSIFFLYLAILTIILYVTFKEASYGFLDGSILAMMLMAILFFASFNIIPFQIGKKTADESSDANSELLYISIKPTAIANGKYLCGAVIILMLYSAITPFLSLTLFIGGLDIRDLLLALFITFIASNLAVLCQVFVGLSLQSTELVGNFTKFIFILGHVIVFFTLCGFGGQLLEGRLINYNNTSESLNIVFWTVGGGIFLSYLMYSLILSKLQPASSNKFHYFRIICSVIWIIGTILSLSSVDNVSIWTAIVVVALCLISVQTLTEPEKYNERIMKHISDNILLRIFGFPFFSGMANAFCWILLTGIATLISSAISYMYLEGRISHHFDEGLKIAMTFVLYTNAYVFLSNFIRKIFAPKGKQSSNIGIFFAIVSVTSFLGFVSANMFRYQDNSFAKIVSLISPFGAFFDYHGEFGSSVFAGIVFLAVTLLLNSKALLIQINEYFSKKLNQPSTGYYSYMENVNRKNNYQSNSNANNINSFESMQNTKKLDSNQKKYSKGDDVKTSDLNLKTNSSSKSGSNNNFLKDNGLEKNSLDEDLKDIVKNQEEK